ncbi:response regulator [Archaeoglobus profundus]|uniref:Response regulator receiver protein n=1 Tax=Archaeoglobus profundus (strain DSM 5631 / JCM 9629 / NBRC 100127 / Av18) TaxID=572546 RepID=D2RH28_ARCPA|nr:response regulator [Archaeoglobus profundus]ADB57603.1 response regulator receiver protein [Archaeoglobus profundus DSM 5631]
MMSKPKVMVVEDDLAVLEAVQVMLGDRYEVIVATNGKEAIEKYQEYKPDIVLMDMLMPVMDGIEATKKIKEIDPQAKIIGLTAYAINKGKELLEAGALEIIGKPFTRSQLIETIEKCLKKTP